MGGVVGGEIMFMKRKNRWGFCGSPPVLGLIIRLCLFLSNFLGS
jgi:hypothetical protein